MSRAATALLAVLAGCVPSGAPVRVGGAGPGGDAAVLDAPDGAPQASDAAWFADVHSGAGPDRDARASDADPSPDAPSLDAEPADASERDAAPHDAEPADGGAARDASGPRDASASDAGAAPCDPAVWVTPHAGLAESSVDPRCPLGMIAVDTFCVDRFEAVLFELTAAGNARAWSPYHNPGARRVRAASIAAVVPQAYVSGRQAAAACAEAGKRLCSNAEWLRACRGSANTTYPYGAQRQPGTCNDARARHPAIEYFGTSASWIWSELDNACINQLPASVGLTGDRVGCVTAEGAYDMMGNVHEWTSDPAGTFRGGYYVDTVINGNGCLYATTAHDVGHWDYSTGFRCCADRP